jgi:hypothetical protein
MNLATRLQKEYIVAYRAEIKPEEKIVDINLSLGYNKKVRDKKKRRRKKNDR